MPVFGSVPVPAVPPVRRGAAQVRFFLGVHQPSDCKHVDAAFVSVHRLVGPKGRKSPFRCKDWIMDSGAFSTILTHGGYPEPPEAYAAVVKHWANNGNLLAAVSQDYMCEPHMLKITGLTVEEHQRLTVERYDALLACDLGGVYLMPVLQGYTPEEYVAHIAMYGDRLTPGMWVGVGSVCKRNGDARQIEAVLLAIKSARPDLRLHGFGLKTTALGSGLVCQLLETADSLAWSYAARREGRNGNDIREGLQFASKISAKARQLSLLPQMIGQLRGALTADGQRRELVSRDHDGGTGA